MNLNSSQRLNHSQSSLRERRSLSFARRFLGVACSSAILLGIASSNQAATLDVMDGLVMRLESIDGVSTDEFGNVSEWMDLTASGHSASQNANIDRRPLFVTEAMPSGAPALRFDGANDLLTIAGQVVTSQDFSIFAVVNAVPASSGHKNLFGNWSAAAGNFGESLFVGITAYQPDTDSAHVRFSDAIPSAGVAQQLRRHSVLDFVNDSDPAPGSATVSQNGISIFTGGPLSTRNLTSNPDTAPYTIGVQGDPDHGSSAGEHWTGDIAALLVYDRPLSSIEQAQVRQYLKDTYLEPIAPAIASVTPPTNTVVADLSSIQVLFDEAVSGVDASDLLINGAAIATNVTVISPLEYAFEFPLAPVGTVNVAFAPDHGIADLASAPNAFAGAEWTYVHNEDTNSPTIRATEPATNAPVNELSSITIIFDDQSGGVTNVDASDLLINGAAIATSLVVSSPSEYTFEFPEPPFGPVNVAFAPDHGITDLAFSPNPFAGASWSYTLDPNAPLALVVRRDLVLQLESISGVISDEAGQVSQWADQSGNGHDATQSNPDRQPLLVPSATATEAPVLRFDGAADLLTLAGQVLTSQDFTIFAVVNATPSTGFRNLFGNWSAAAGNTVSSIFVGLAAYQAGNDSATVRFSDVFQNAGTVGNVAQHFLIDFTTDSDPTPGFSTVSQNGLSIFAGGALSVRTLTANPTNGPYTIGVQGDPEHGVSAGEYWAGDIAALLVYDRPLSSTERRSVQQYLSESYVAQDETAPQIASTDVPPGVTVRDLDSITVFFDENVRKVDASDLLINGVALATNMIATSPRQYTFQFPQPSTGTVSIAFAPNHGIIDLAYGRNAFPGTTWSFTLDPNAAFAPVTEGLVLRLESTSGVITDATGHVSRWADDSGIDTEAFQDNTDRQPLLVAGATPSGAPALRFDGIDDLLTLAKQALTSESFSIFAVINATPRDAGNKNLFGNWSLAAGNLGSSVFVGLAGYQSATDSASVRFTDLIPSAGTAARVSQHFVLDLVTANDPPPGSSEVSQDGVAIFMGGALTGRNLMADPANGPYTIGAQGDPDHGVTAGEYWTGDVAALLLYDRALSIEERVAVRQYLDVTYLAPTPKLAIHRITLTSGEGVRISWPQSGSVGFILQSTTTLPADTWTDITPAEVEGTEFVVTDLLSNSATGAKFYRLQKQ